MFSFVFSVFLFFRMCIWVWNKCRCLFRMCPMFKNKILVKHTQGTKKVFFVFSIYNEIVFIYFFLFLLVSIYLWLSCKDSFILHFLSWQGKVIDIYGQNQSVSFLKLNNLADTYFATKQMFYSANGCELKNCFEQKNKLFVTNFLC